MEVNRVARSLPQSGIARSICGKGVTMSTSTKMPESSFQILMPVIRDHSDHS
jgi:hypothetical protein